MFSGALVRLIEEHGGVDPDRQDGERLIVENGRCIGVECADGSSYRADKAVLSTIHIKHLIDMAPRQAWADDFVDGRRDLAGRADACSSRTMRPASRCGSRSTAACASRWRAACCRRRRERCAWATTIARGAVNIEEPVLLAVCPTLGDPGQAPAGRHTVKIIGMQPYDLKEGPQHWDEIKEQVSQANLDYLRRFAPNLTDDKILARVVESPLDLERMNPHNWHGSCHGGAQNAGAVREHAAGARLGAASHADPGPLPDRLDHPSRRLDFRRTRPKCRGRDAQGFR